MVVDESLISTGVDNLLHLVYSKGRVKLLDASRELGIPSNALEEWARVLEEEGILKLEYQLTTIFLVWAGTPKEETAGRKEEFIEKKASLSDEIDLMLERVRERGFDIEASKAGLGRMPSLLDQQSVLLKQKLEKIKAFERESEKLLLRYSQSFEKIKAGFSSLEENVSKGESRLKSAQSDLSSLEEKAGRSFPRFSDLKKEVERAQASLEALQEEEAKLRESNKIIEAQLAKAQKTSSDLRALYAAAKEGLASFRKELAQQESSLEGVSSGKAEIAASLKSTQSDFEKLKIAYSANLESLSSVGKRISSELVSMRREMQESVSEAEAIIAREPVGKRVDELNMIQKQLDSLAGQQQNLERKMLELKDELAEISSAGMEPAFAEAGKKAEAVKKKLIELKAEEDAFERKRSELRELIKKMGEGKTR